MRAFTLFELLIVMTVIAIIAALGLGSMRYAQDYGAASKTKALLKTVELALEKYHQQYGQYPDLVGSGSTLNGMDSGGAWLLYEVMTGDGDRASGGGNASDGDIAATEKPMLEGVFSGNDDKFSNVDQDNAGNFVVVDGWGNPLQYRRGDDPDALNGTYDLWSYGAVEAGVPGGQEKWIKNW